MTGIVPHILPTEGPDDTSKLESLIQTGEINPEHIICVLGKTEGNGCVNDFSRGLATMAYQRAIARHTMLSEDEVQQNVLFIMSGGTEGYMTPHVTVFCQEDNNESQSTTKNLAGGIARTRDFEPTEIGRIEQVNRTADAVQTAMERADISNFENVHFVQVKCPLLHSTIFSKNNNTSKSLITTNSYKSMKYSRAASALGVGLGTDELSSAEINQDVINNDWSIYSSVASTSAGVELKHSEVLVLGNSESSNTEYRIGSSTMQDSLDTDAVTDAITSAGSKRTDSQATICNTFAKAQAPSDGLIRGRRHVIHDDSDIQSTRHARSVVNSVIGAVTGDPLSYVSGGAEHQGPDGGGPIAVIANTAD